MTLPAPIEDVACPVCGVINQPDRLLSTHSFGSPDLDLRPAPDMGRLLAYMVESCHACGYAASSLGDSPKGGTTVAMASPEWQALLTRKDLPELAATFKRAEMIASQSQGLVEAVWMALRAVWVGDDSKSAITPTLRREAVSLIQQVMASGSTFVSQGGGNEAVISDLFRRAGDWDQAVQWAKRGLDVADDAVVSAVLKFELRLIGAQDGEVHQIEEAVRALENEHGFPTSWHAE
jgi:hypothetical protein